MAKSKVPPKRSWPKPKNPQLRITGEKNPKLGYKPPAGGKKKSKRGG